MTIKEMNKKIEEQCAENPELIKENAESILLGLLGLAALSMQAAINGEEVTEDTDINKLFDI